MSAVADQSHRPSISGREALVNLTFMALFGGGLLLAVYRLSWHQEDIPVLCEVIVGIGVRRLSRPLTNAWLRRIITLPWYAVDLWFCVELDWHRVWWCLLALLAGILICLPAWFRARGN